MPIVKYTPKNPGDQLRFGFPEVGEVLVVAGEQDLDEAKCKALRSLTEQPSFQDLKQVLDFSPSPSHHSEPQPETKEEEPKESVIDIPDIEEMRAEEAIATIEKITDPDLLAILLQSEQAGKKRSTVINAIQLKVAAK